MEVFLFTIIQSKTHMFQQKLMLKNVDDVTSLFHNCANLEPSLHTPVTAALIETV